MSMTSIKQINGGKELQGDVHALLNIVGKDKEAFFNEILNWLLSEAPQDFNPEILRSSKLVKLVSSAVTVNNESDVPTKTPYLSFIEENGEPFTLKTNNLAKNWDGTLEYSTDTQNWSEWDGAEISSSSDGKLYLRGIGNSKITGSINIQFVLTDNKRIQCLGNIENLLDYATVSAGNHPVMADFCYSSIFCDCTSLTAAPALPATTLTKICYSKMFSGCTSLTQAPELPATILIKNCYTQMFKGCTSLTKAPEELPATTLAGNCYSSMFADCTSLTGTIHCPASTANDEYRLDANSNNIPANTATVVYDL